MLYQFLLNFVDTFGFLNVFKYLTFRASGAFITSIFISFLVGPKLIQYFKVKQKLGQPIRNDGPKWQIEAKKGTPTMGGALILFALTVSVILWTDLFNIYLWLVLFITLSFGLIGFIDDYLKLKKFSFKGLSGKIKIITVNTIHDDNGWTIKPKFTTNSQLANEDKFSIICSGDKIYSTRWVAFCKITRIDKTISTRLNTSKISTVTKPPVVRVPFVLPDVKIFKLSQGSHASPSPSKSISS